ncbi:MAG: aspartate kinase [Candidatus Delongbacteria bacterium]|nr:aspartate kinase [Candidatus Delongbacteria bacterium]
MLVVQKYGGSSLDSPDKIKAIAERVVARYLNGDKLVLVVSAAGNTTNKLQDKAFELSTVPDPRELDMLVSIGERESISLMSIAINSIKPGLARSFTGSQIGLITDCNHRNARILEIKGDRLKQALEEGRIPVIAGFQGVSINKEITTLGRGGSDTTAVAVTAALNADHCEIYSDVIGVYSSDPKVIPDANLIKELDYDTMLEISSSGAKVLKDSAVEYAKRLGIKIFTGLSSNGYMGTIISKDVLNKNKYTALVYNDKLVYKLNTASEDTDFSCLDKVKLFQTFGDSKIIIFEDENSTFERCYSLTVVGSGTRSDKVALDKMHNFIKEVSNIIAVEISDIKFAVYFENIIDQKMINKIHSLFF